MEKHELLKMFQKQEDKLLAAKIWDKLKFVHLKNQIQVTDFFDGYQQNIAIKCLNCLKENSFILDGGYQEAQRKMLFLYPEKLEAILKKEDSIKVISITLPPELKENYNHSEYLGGIMKLGIKREKIGDIIVNENGADVLVQTEMANYLKEHLQNLTRFQKAIIEIKEISDLIIAETQKEELTILIPQMRLDVIVSEILHLSRSKANEIISQERVFVNYELKTKNASSLKEGDVLTVRGKGKYEIGEILSTTSKGKLKLQVKKYI